MTAPKRILAVDDDDFFLQIVADQLGAAGFEVSAESEPTRVVPHATELVPDLILMDRLMPLLSGGEVIRALKAFPTTQTIPVAFLTSETSELETLRALRSGAVDVLVKPFGADTVDRVHALMEDLVERPVPSGADPRQRLAHYLLGHYRRARTSVTMLLNPGTPFEGRAAFDQGNLVSAEYGPVTGQEALGEMLGVEDGVWRFEAAAEEDDFDVDIDEAPAAQAPVPTAAPAVAAKPRILFVDDEPDICRLFQIQLSRAGFDVDTAEDGQVGFDRAIAAAYDVIVADLNMPRLDGWGLLRLVKADHRTREVPVVFLSAHDDYRETLKAAHAGASDYLAKTGRSEHVVGRVQALVAPRQNAQRMIQGQRRAIIDVSLVGAQWLVRALGASHASGTFEARDEWGQYLVTFREGEISEATATTATRTVSAVPALAALFVSRGALGTFNPGPVSVDKKLGIPLAKAVSAASDLLNQLEARVATAKVTAAGTVRVDQELYRLFLRIASDRDLILARAVCEGGVKPADLAARLSLTADEVQAGLKELLRRRVISFEADA